MTDKLATPTPGEPPRLSKFGPAAIDRAINQTLLASVPGQEDTAILDVKLTNMDGERVVTGVVAANLGHGWGLAAGAALDLEDRDDWEVEVLVKASW
jgi:hypothetical protein